MKTYPALILVKIEESEVGLTAWDSEGRYIVVQPDQIAPEVEAAPSDTDLRAELSRVGLPETASLADLIQHHRANAATAAALDALCSQPVQVEADIKALIEEAKSYIGTNWDFGFPDGVMQRMVNVLSRPAQPVQVEVTDNMVEKAAEALATAGGWRWSALHGHGHGARSQDSFRAQARAALSAALEQR